METRTLKVRVTTRKTKDGREFNAYETFSKNGRSTKLKFRKEVKNLPEKDCYIVVNVDDINVNTKNEYPECWVSAIQEIRDTNVVDTERNKKEVTDYFGE